MRPAILQMGRRCFLGTALAVAVAGCSREPEPDEAAIREAVERLHQDWSAEVRKAQKIQQAQIPELFRSPPGVNLAFEASLEMRITSVRKIHCDPAPGGELGYVCVAVVGASVAGRAPVLQNIQGRFVRGGTKWLVHDLVVLKTGG
ncbi:MAG: hypothetical protein JO128_20060 [Alphaproteobacteria bacterium]|nr:hypothetical protein [Alphaproteobacteria bacterium]